MSFEIKFRIFLILICVVGWLALHEPRKKSTKAELASDRSKTAKNGCKHRPFKTADGSIPYAEVCRGAIDGHGREHADIRITCAKCYGTYAVCRIHLPSRDAERVLRDENKQLRETLSHFMEGI